MSVQEKEIKMATAATTLGYTNNNNNLPNRDSTSSSSQNQTSSDQPQTPTLVFNNNPPQNLLYTPHLAPPQNQQQAQRPPTDPDLTTTRTVTVTVPTAQPQQTRSTKIRYRECLRNHAASMGSHVVDGCGEFMPSGEETTPESLKCAACACHRNFHRKVVKDRGEHSQHHHQHIYYPNNNNGGHLHFPTPSSLSLPHRRFSSHVSPTRARAAGPLVQPSPLMMAFGGPAAESSSEHLNVAGAQFSVHPQTLLKKRFRTKFSQEQKDRMVELAEKLGWKIQKHDEHEVEQFCSQLGIKRQVFKVWMHNNKASMKKQRM